MHTKRLRKICRKFCHNHLNHPPKHVSKESNMKDDILNTRSEELRQQPFRVPEGYFGKLENDLRQLEEPVNRGFFRVIAPYASMAAAFIIMVTAGTFFLKSTTEQDGMTYEDFLVHSDYVLSESYDELVNVVEAEEIADEDIIEYLIYTGVTAEVIEISK